jgi:hypothetical protein
MQFDTIAFTISLTGSNHAMVLGLEGAPTLGQLFVANVFVNKRYNARDEAGGTKKS